MNTGTEGSIVFKTEPMDTDHPIEERDWRSHYRQALGTAQPEDMKSVVKQEIVELDTLTEDNAEIGEVRYARLWEVSSNAIGGPSDRPGRSSGIAANGKTPTASFGSTDSSAFNRIWRTNFGKTRHDTARHGTRYGTARPKCKCCNKMFVDEEELRKHIEERATPDTEDDLAECPVCKRTLSRKRDLEKHMLTHTTDKSYRCETCERKFTRLTSMKIHMTSHSKCGSSKRQNRLGGSSSIAVSGKTLSASVGFADSSAFDRIWRTNFGKMPHRSQQWKCDCCYIMFLDREELRKHIEERAIPDTESDPAECQICKRTLARKGDLKKHMLTHRYKSYRCEICERKFTELTSMKVHMTHHSKGGSTECNICKKTFECEGGLNRHLQAHIRGKLYRCKVCRWAGVDFDDFVDHLRIHTGEGLFRCRVCELAFARLRTLERHMTVHTERNCTVVNDAEGRSGPQPI